MRHLHSGHKVARTTSMSSMQDTAAPKPKRETPSRTTMRHWMTPAPHSVGKGQTLAVAKRIMCDYAVRYLPVLDQGKLVGILSELDIYFVQAIPGVNLEDTLVADAMSQHVHCASPDQQIRAVVAQMAEYKLGCAVITEGDKVVGMFTTTDALDMLALNVARAH